MKWFEGRKALRNATGFTCILNKGAFHLTQFSKSPEISEKFGTPMLFHSSPEFSGNSNRYGKRPKYRTEPGSKATSIGINGVC